MNAACPRRVSLIIAGGLPAIPTPTISAPTGDRPAASGFTPAPTGFAFHSQARPATPTESSSRRTARRPSCVSDWSFSFRCSPPRVTTAQLRFDTARFFTAQERTSTALSPRLLRRTSADIPVGILEWSRSKRKRTSALRQAFLWAFCVRLRPCKFWNSVQIRHCSNGGPAIQCGHEL